LELVCQLPFLADAGGTALEIKTATIAKQETIFMRSGKPKRVFTVPPSGRTGGALETNESRS
jgi:hypothetical protein